MIGSVGRGLKAGRGRKRSSAAVESGVGEKKKVRLLQESAAQANPR